MKRRAFVASTAGALGALSAGCSRQETVPAWSPEAFRRPDRSSVFVLRAERYDVPLEDGIARGLRHCGIDPSGRRVLLKPNFVEYDPGGVINTHPAVIQAAIDAFRRLGASNVVVAEGSGHRRDVEYLLDGTGLRDVLRDTGTRFIDLNLGSVARVAPRARFSQLGPLFLPEAVLDADLVVSMPKLKTHHWAGVTLSLKNMFGVIPGAVYGWPKNVLHWAGIEESILDINAAMTRVDRFNIVDGITGMEGNGPIQGRPKPAGVLVLGSDPVAVDATCCRIMMVEPSAVRYLREAGKFLGNVPSDRIDQRGEEPGLLAVPFDLTERFAGLRLRMSAGTVLGPESPEAANTGS